jgi:hypothetical protein
MGPCARERAAPLTIAIATASVTTVFIRILQLFTDRPKITGDNLVRRWRIGEWHCRR